MNVWIVYHDRPRVSLGEVLCGVVGLSNVKIEEHVVRYLRSGRFIHVLYLKIGACGSFSPDDGPVVQNIVVFHRTYKVLVVKPEV